MAKARKAMKRKPVKKTKTSARKPAARKSSSGAEPVIAYLTVSNGAGALEYYAKAFGARENARMMADDGKRLMHASFALNGGTVMMSDDFPEYKGGQRSTPEHFGGSPVAVHLNFKKPAEVDAIVARAAKAGGKVDMQPQDTFWGMRFAMFTDPFGHRWMFGAPLKKK